MTSNSDGNSRDHYSSSISLTQPESANDSFIHDDGDQELIHLEGSRLSLTNGHFNHGHRGSRRDLLTTTVVNSLPSDESSQEWQPYHCHKSNTAGSQSTISSAQRRLIITSVLCFSFMICELIGGYVSNSLAIMTDAAHLLSDLLSFIVSLAAIHIGRRKPNRSMSYGYNRAEILGALASILLIWILTGVLVYVAALRIHTMDFEIGGQTMIIVSGVGVAFNLVMGVTLSTDCSGKSGDGDGDGHVPQHGHSHLFHGHSHSNINVRAALIHVLGDLIQSVGVLVAAYVIYYKPEYKIADPICTFIFSGLVMLTTYSIFKESVHILMEGRPKDVDYELVKSQLNDLTGVRLVHNFHIWSLSVGKNLLTAHLVVDTDSVDAETVLQSAQMLLTKNYNFQEATIQVEKYRASVVDNCQECLSSADTSPRV